ncbi:MAG: glucosamine-6-phosphate isomerase [Verrucomicrobiota bacterium]
MFPDYLSISAADLGKDQPVKVKIVGDATDLAKHMATDMLEEIKQAKAAGRGATLIIPVGPVDQFPILAEMINKQRISCRDTMLINMDEYLDLEDQWIPLEHPLSFRGFMERRFYSLLDPELAPAPENRVFPDPRQPRAIGEIIKKRGGVDVCIGGIGINGHLAFNEPPEMDEAISTDEFATFPTRVLSLTRETRTINSVTVGGEISIVPTRAITVGMKEIMESYRLRFYCNRPWQSAVVRRALHGPLSARFPASYLREHLDATLTVTDFVAAPPNIMLR